MDENEYYCILFDGVCMSGAHAIPNCHLCKYIGFSTDEEPCESCEKWSNFEKAGKEFLTGRIDTEKFTEHKKK